METINENSLATLEFGLRWKSDKGSHEEKYLAQHVNFWRDILPGELYQPLMGKGLDERVTHTFPAGDIISPFKPGQILKLAQRQFERRVINGQTVEPSYGRYYPKGLLKGVAGVYSNNLEPFRCVGVDAKNLEIDFNHPLSRNELDVNITVKDIIHKPSDRGGRLTDWMEEITNGPGMQIRTNGQPTDFFSNNPFQRPDETADRRFYKSPRMVSHLDERAREQIGNLYERLLEPETDVLDLMSSWQSHIPAPLQLSSLTGLGLNEEELRKNPLLSEQVVHDLNSHPVLPFEAERFDAVICTASVEYLTRPFQVFKDVARVLKPGGLFIHTFSNRWFSPKAIRVWSELTEFERMGLVTEYFLESGVYEKLHTYSSRGWPRPHTDKYYPELLKADPVYAVWGYKKKG